MKSTLYMTVAVAVLALTVWVGRGVTQSAVPVAPAPIQVFQYDAVDCFGTTDATGFAGSNDPYNPTTVSLDPQVLACNDATDAVGGLLTVGRKSVTQATMVPIGSSLTLGVTWTNNFGLKVSTAASAGGRPGTIIAEGTQIGRVASAIDLLCNDTGDGSAIDIFRDSGGAGVTDEQVIAQTTAWCALTGPIAIPPSTIGAIDETFIDKVLPSSTNTFPIPAGTLFGRIARYRADINQLFLGRVVLAPRPLDATVPLSFFAMEPAWAAGTTATFQLLAGAPSPPSTDLNCIDSAQAAIQEKLDRLSHEEAVSVNHQ